MTNGIRRTEFYGIAGVLLASIIIFGFIASNNLLASGKGTLTILVMDKPVELLELNLSIDQVGLQHDDGTWTTFETKIGVFNLLDLQEESMELLTTSVNAGGYNKIWLYVPEPVVAKYLDSEGFEQENLLNVPSGVVKIFFNPSITVASDGGTMVLIDLQPENLDSIGVSSENSLNLRPVIKAIVPVQTTEATSEPSPPAA